MADESPSVERNDADRKLGGAFRSALFWNIANMGVSQAISVALFIFLTYKLDPIVFGVFALGVLIVDYFNYQIQSASVDAIIQSQDFSPRGLSSVFWAIFAIFLIGTLAIVMSGNLAARMLNEPRLASVLPALGLTILPLPFAMPCNAKLLAMHDFRGVAIRGILCAALSGIAALLSAMGPAPEWALVVQRAVQVCVYTLFVMLRAKWVPQFIFSFSIAWSFLTRMARIFFSQAIGSSYMRVLDIVVGMAFGAAAVGLMRIASRFVDSAQAAFATPIGSLWVILLSAKESRDSGDRANILTRLTQMSALICVPLFAGLALTAQDLVDFVLDPDYAGASTYLVILALGGTLAPVAYFRNHALTALGRLNTLVILSIVDIGIITAAALLLRSISAEAVVSSLLLMNLVRVVVSAPIMVNAVGARWQDFVGAQLPAYLGCVVMAVVIIYVIGPLDDFEPYVRLGVKAVAGASAYFVYLMIFHSEWVDRAMELLINRKMSESFRMISILRRRILTMNFMARPNRDR